MRGCEWQALENGTRNIKPKISPFLYEKEITEEKILDAIESNGVFGIIKADVETPETVIQKYGDLNFPFIFRSLDVTEEMLSPEVLQKAKNRKKKFPASYKTLCWNASGIVLATPMVQFYRKIGMVVKNIEWVIQYYESKPFTSFVDKLVEVRIANFQTNKPVADRAKFTLNSCVGRFGMNVGKHRKVNYVKPENLNRYYNPRVESKQKLASEDDIDLYEVISKPKIITDTIPVAISLFVYQVGLKIESKNVNCD